MPLIEVHLIEKVFSPQQKQQIIEKLTDAMVSIEGENMRGVTWVKISEVSSGALPFVPKVRSVFPSIPIRVTVVDPTLVVSTSRIFPSG